MDEKRNLSGKVRLIATTAGVAASALTMHLTEQTRSQLKNTVNIMGEAHGDKMAARAQEPGVSAEEVTVYIQIQTSLELIEQLIEDNERFHAFWALGWDKIPNFPDTDERLEDIHEKLQNPTATLGELETLNQQLAVIISEFMIIMRGDEEFVAQELREGMAYMSDDDISMIQEYMRECLYLIHRELSMGDTESDYLLTSGTDMDTMIRDFIREEDLVEARKYMIALVEHFRKLSGEDSSFAFHHLAEIAERLRKGDNPDEIWAKYFGIVSGSGAALLILITGIYILVRMTALINWWNSGVRRARDLQRMLEKIEHSIQQTFGVSVTASIVGWHLAKPARDKIRKAIKPATDKIRKAIKPLSDKIRKLIQKIWREKTGSPPPLDIEELPANGYSSADINTPPPLPPLPEE